MKVFNLRCDFFFFMPFFYNTPAGLKLLTIDFGYNRKSEIIVKPLTKVQSQKHLNCACKMTIAPYCNKKSIYKNFHMQHFLYAHVCLSAKKRNLDPNSTTVCEKFLGLQNHVLFIKTW